MPILVEEEAQVPSYATIGAAGADLSAHIKEPLIVEPGRTALVPTGLKVAIPEGFELQVRPRSGLALRYGITVLNTPGTIDSDYRGSIGVILINHGHEPFRIEPGMRIAQLVLCRVFQARFVAHESLLASTRGEGGFGSTGTGSKCP
ncbi:MAG: dUTP diphosphatase [Verrucomicrobia bacterium]|nr:dUTP diphosphatase [Verrucomicrobiota bacterium]